MNDPTQVVEYKPIMNNRPFHGAIKKQLYTNETSIFKQGRTTIIYRVWFRINWCNHLFYSYCY